jgi:hypothetical protein
MDDQTKRQILSLMTQLLRDGADRGSREELVFGEELENLLYSANGQARDAEKWMNLLATAVLRGDSRGLDFTIKALRGSLVSLMKLADNVGRYYGNPSRRLRASQKPSAERVAERYLALKRKAD